MTVDELTRRALESGAFAGAVVRVEREGSAKFEQAWGLALDTPWESVPMTTEMIFDLASVTKLFTTTAILRLATLGQLSLTDRLADLLGYTGTDLSTLMGSADVASALAHATGFHPWYPFYTRPDQSFESTLEQILRDHPSLGTSVYSDLNFILLGRVVSSVTGCPLADALEDLVFSPLALEHTSFQVPLGPVAATEWGNQIEQAMVADRNLEFHGWRDTSRPIQGTCNDGNTHYYFHGVSGHAGIFSDARDLCRLGRVYLSDDAYLNASLRNRATRDLGTGRGLGFQFGEPHAGSGFGHTGFTGTCLSLNPRRNLTVAILTNRLHVPNPRKVTEYFQSINEAVLHGLG